VAGAGKTLKTTHDAGLAPGEALRRFIKPGPPVPATGVR
jgi:hypothetical protein